MPVVFNLNKVGSPLASLTIWNGNENTQLSSPPVSTGPNIGIVPNDAFNSYSGQ